MEINGPSGTLRVAVALLLGLGAMGYGAYSYTEQASALSSSETVEATIVSTSVETNDKRRGVSYTPRATFNYTYEGDAYTGSNVYPGPLPRTFDTEEAARSRLEAYEPGETVPAHVPVDDPSGAFLKHTRSNGPFVVIGIGALLVIGTLYSSVRSR